MAYDKVNWNTIDTFMNPTNFNKMDNKIADLDINKADKADLTALSTLITQLQSGWINMPGIITSITYDASTATVELTTSQDLTSVIELGDRLKFTNNGLVKFGIVHVKATTKLTVFLGTDYNNIVGTTITDLYYSHMRSPIGFPTASDKWTITITNTAGANVGTPNAGAICYTQFGSIILNVPPGTFEVELQNTQGANRSTSSDLDVVTCLSTSSTAAVGTFSIRAYTLGLNITLDLAKKRIITVSAKTPYYFIAYTNMTTVAQISIKNIVITCKSVYA